MKDVPGFPNGRHSSDLEWIDYLRAQSEIWVFVSDDGRILKNRAERAALRGAKLHGFVLAAAYERTPLHQVAATIVWKWPEIERVTELIAPPSMHEIPIGKSVKLRSLPL